MRICMILLIGYLTMINAFACNKINYEYLLSADSIKYWNKVTPNFKIEGLAFRASDHQPFWYDENRYYSYSSAQEIAFQKVWMIKNNNLEIQLWHDSTPVGDKEVFQIIKLTEDSLILSKNGYRVLYMKSKDQKTELTLKPEQRRGYIFAQIASQKQIEQLIKSTYKMARKQHITFPKQIQVNVYVSLGKDGLIKRTTILDKSHKNSKYNSFYVILLSRLKNMKFFPAYNEYTGERYDCDFCIPIKYQMDDTQ